MRCGSVLLCGCLCGGVWGCVGVHLCVLHVECTHDCITTVLHSNRIPTRLVKAISEDYVCLMKPVKGSWAFFPPEKNCIFVPLKLAQSRECGGLRLFETVDSILEDPDFCNKRFGIVSMSNAFLCNVIVRGCLLSLHPTLLSPLLSSLRLSLHPFLPPPPSLLPLLPSLPPPALPSPSLPTLSKRDSVCKWLAYC